jgi:glutathione S-transferase
VSFKVLAVRSRLFLTIDKALTMLTLRTSPATPFGRKISMALGVIGMTDAVECVNADTLSDTDSLRQQNPLGKIPTLLLDDGEAVYDSAVIIEYLNQLDGRNLLIPAADTAGAAHAGAGRWPD